MLIFVVLVAAYFALNVNYVMPDPALPNERLVLGWLVSANESAQRHVSGPYQKALASGVGATVRALGYDARVEGRQIRSPDFAMAVAHGCDAVELSLLLAAALLAYPASLKGKFIGLLTGVAAIAIMNFVRVVTLWMVGVHWRAGFDFIHFNLWPAVLVCFTFALFAGWVLGAARKPRVLAEAGGRNAERIFPT